MLRANDISKTFTTKGKKNLTALKDINLSFGSSGLVFLLGESGSGKSTLLSIIGGLAKPTSGDVYASGILLSSMNEEDLASFRYYDNAFVFQENVFVEDLDVKGNVLLGVKEDDESISKASEALNRVGLSGFESRQVNELSGGQKQRVAIARTLVRQCRTMLCDEPTAALDEDNATRLLNLLAELAKDHLIIVASHDRDSAFRYGDRIIEISNGVVIQDLTAIDSDSGITYSGDRIFIPATHKITNQELLELETRLKRNEVTKVFSGSKTRSFQPTEQTEARQEEKENHPRLFSAFSAPKRLWRFFFGKRKKQYGLAIAVLGLSCSLFGTALLSGSFNERRAYIDTLSHATADVIAIRKEEVFDDGSINYVKSGQLSDGDIEKISSYFNRPFLGVSQTTTLNLSAYAGSKTRTADTYSTVPLEKGVGLSEINRDFFEKSGFKFVVGDYPKDNESIVVSTEFVNFFRQYGYKCPYGNNPKSNLGPGFGYEEILGKPFKIGETTVEVSGVVKFTTDYSRYSILKEADKWNTASYFGGYETEYTECVEDDFAWNIYVSNVKDYGIESYSMAITTIPKNKDEIAKYYDAFEGGNKTPELSGFTMRNPHLRITKFMIMNMGVFSGIFWVFGGIFGVISLLLIVHLQLTMVSTEKRHIGLYRAMGASKKDVFLIYLPQAIILALTSALLGVIFLFAIPAIINAIVANELVYVGSLLAAQFWHVLILIGIPLLAAVASLVVVIAPPLKKDPFDLLK